MYFEFHANHCLVKSQDTHEVLLQGQVGADGLYVFPSLHIQPPRSSVPSCFVIDVSNNAVNSTVSPSSQFKWHLRLGHPNNNVLKIVLKSCNIPLSIIDDSFCSACCIGIAHRLHSPSSTTTYTSPLELVYSDLRDLHQSPHQIISCIVTIL